MLPWIPFFFLVRFCVEGRWELLPTSDLVQLGVFGLCFSTTRVHVVGIFSRGDLTGERKDMHPASQYAFLNDAVVDL